MEWTWLVFLLVLLSANSMAQLTQDEIATLESALASADLPTLAVIDPAKWDGADAATQEAALQFASRAVEIVETIRALSYARENLERMRADAAARRERRRP